MANPSDRNKLSQLAATKAGARLFRMNVGLSWMGEVVAKNADTITLKNARPIKAGVVGMSDGLGFVPVTITPDMVGQTVAVFLAIEDKTGTGRLSTEQRAFIQMVRKFGGRAGVARSDDDVVAIVAGGVRD